MHKGKDGYMVRKITPNIWTIFRQLKRTSILIYGLLAPVSVAASTVFAMSLQPVIDAGTSGDMAAFWRASFFAVVCVVIDNGVSYLEQVQRVRMIAICTRNLRIRYFEAYFRQDITAFLSEDSAAHLSKLTIDSEAVATKYCGGILNIYKSVCTLAISIFAIASARWELALYVVIFSFLTVNLPKLFQKGADSAEQNFLDSSNHHIAKVQESINNYLVIRLHNLVTDQVKKYRKIACEVEKSENIRQQKAFSIDTVAVGISSLSFVLIIAFTMLLVLQGKLSIGYTMSISQLLGGIMVPFEMLPGYLLAYRTGRELYQANEKRMETVLENGGKEKLVLSPANSRIQMNKVSFSFDNGSRLLNDINISFDMGKKYALVGVSGSGKSTLSKIMMGFLKIPGGEVLIGGVSMNTIDKKSLYRTISYQSQTVSFFQDTIKNNILLGTELSDEEWRAIVVAAHLEDMLEKLADKEYSMIMENGKNISGGEAQRIGLARCLAAHPQFMIFDEIAASLDNQTAMEVENSILALQNVGVLMITHRIYEANMRQYDKILVLKDGVISEQGSWDELINKRGDFYELVNLQSVNQLQD